MVESLNPRSNEFPIKLIISKNKTKKTVLTLGAGVVLADVGQRSDQRQSGFLAAELVLMFVSLEERVDDLVPRLDGQRASIDHILADQFGDLLQADGFHIQHDGTVQQQTPELEQRVQREGCHVRLGPPVATLFDVLLELDPPGGFLPGHLVALLDQLFHLGEQRV